MANKNPFEIRADMLAMAKDYMDQTWQLNYTFVQQLFEQNKITAAEMQQALEPYSTKELMEKAQEFYSFVSKKD
jgi:hypothetical protein